MVPQTVLKVLTDGDLRRACCGGRPAISNNEVATSKPLTIGPDVLMADAEAKMLESRVQCLLVVDATGAVVGVIQTRIGLPR